MRYISLCEVHCMGRNIFICCVEWTIFTFLPTQYLKFPSHGILPLNFSRNQSLSVNFFVFVLTDDWLLGGRVPSGTGQVDQGAWRSHHQPQTCGPWPWRVHVRQGNPGVSCRPCSDTGDVTATWLSSRVEQEFPRTLKFISVVSKIASRMQNSCLTQVFPADFWFDQTVNFF